MYQGHKIVWWWAQGGTALSSGEVGQGYREVADPSVYVKFPLLDDDGNVTDTSLLVWTTTPWTLPSNQFVAVHPHITYSTVTDEETGEKLVIASDLVEQIAEKTKRELTASTLGEGKDLLYSRYAPPFDCYHRTLGDSVGTKRAAGMSKVTEPTAWHPVSAEFVTTDSGTGLVHIAPAFGEDDYAVLAAGASRVC